MTTPTQEPRKERKWFGLFHRHDWDSWMKIGKPYAITEYQAFLGAFKYQENRWSGQAWERKCLNDNCPSVQVKQTHTPRKS